MSTPPSPDTTAGPVLASDAERESVVARLHDALGEGRLDLPETETRVAAAYAARHRHDLPPLLSDLPATSPTTAGAPTWAAIWSSLVWRLRLALGLVDADRTPPTARQCRTAGLVVALVLTWLLVCAAAGALVA